MGPAREARLSARLLRLFTGASHGFPHRPWARSVQGAACAAIYGQRKGKEKMTQELIPDPRAHASTVADMMQRAAELNEGKEVANVRMHREQLAVIVAALRAYAVPECGTLPMSQRHPAPYASEAPMPTGHFATIVWGPMEQTGPNTWVRRGSSTGATLPPQDAAPVSASGARLPFSPTEEMADAVRGVLQIIRNKPGATFQDVLDHCEQRGDDTGKWPLWVQDAEGYVTEQGAAMAIYEIMEAARYALSASGASK